MIIAIDFDGTIVEHKYPILGKEVPGAFKWMKRFQELGAKLILYTMRDAQQLDDAVEFCFKNGIEFWGVNNNPQQIQWTASPKVYAHLYIDDAAYGCPLVTPYQERAYVDWNIVGPDVEKKLLEWLTK